MEEGANMTAILRYDGRYDWIPGEEGKQWTILNHWIDAAGQDRYKGTFGIKGLRELGIVPHAK